MHDLRLPSDSGEEEINIVQNYLGTHYPAFVVNYMDDQGLMQTATFQIGPARLMKIVSLLVECEHKLLDAAARLIAKQADDLVNADADEPNSNVVRFRKRD